MWYLIYCVVKSVLLILTSLLFELNNHPEDPSRNLSPFQMLVGRSVIGIMVMIVWQNVGLKKAVWDGIKRDQVSPLIFRSIQGATNQTILYGTTKYLLLTVIAIIESMQPLVTVVMAYLILKEKMKRFEVIIMILSVTAIILFSVFGSET